MFYLNIRVIQHNLSYLHFYVVLIYLCEFQNFVKLHCYERVIRNFNDSYEYSECITLLRCIHTKNTWFHYHALFILIITTSNFSFRTCILFHFDHILFSFIILFFVSSFCLHLNIMIRWKGSVKLLSFRFSIIIFLLLHYLNSRIEIFASYLNF